MNTATRRESGRTRPSTSRPPSRKSMAIPPPAYGARRRGRRAVSAANSAEPVTRPNPWGHGGTVYPTPRTVSDRSTLSCHHGASRAGLRSQRVAPTWPACARAHPAHPPRLLIDLGAGCRGPQIGRSVSVPEGNSWRVAYRRAAFSCRTRAVVLGGSKREVRATPPSDPHASKSEIGSWAWWSRSCEVCAATTRPAGRAGAASWRSRRRSSLVPRARQHRTGRPGR
jgi:hypothetical protein